MTAGQRGVLDQAGLFWLAVVGVLLFLGTTALGWVRHRS